MDEGEKILAQLEDQIANCMRCGNCMEVCPIYKEVKKESGVARGKLAVIEAINKGFLEISTEFTHLMSVCTSCKACAAKCPCGVKPDEIIIKAREAIVKSKGLHPIKKSIFRLLRNRFLFNIGMGMAGIFGGIVFRKLPGKAGAVPRISMPGMKRNRVIAPIATWSLRSQYEAVIPARKTPKMRVGYFTGCVANFMYTDIGKAVIDVLNINDIEVVLPKKQHCCGVPVYTSGDVAMAKVFAQHNIAVFEQQNLDYIITSCGSCAAAWKSEYPEIFKDDKVMREKAQYFSEKTYEISQFLVDITGFDREKLGAVPMTVTMHDPCHMARGIHVTRQPRQILQAIPDLKLIEMKDPACCCGAGGSFCVAHYDLSQQINDRKIKDIALTGVQTVATSCGSCRMHITDGLVRNQLPKKVVHTIQLLDLAYKNKL